MGSQRLPLPLPPPRPAPGHRARGGREKKDNGFCVFNLPPFWTRSVLLSYKAFYHILLDVWVYDSLDCGSGFFLCYLLEVGFPIWMDSCVEVLVGLAKARRNSDIPLGSDLWPWIFVSETTTILWFKQSVLLYLELDEKLEFFLWVKNMAYFDEIVVVVSVSSHWWNILVPCSPLHFDIDPSTLAVMGIDLCYDV